MANSVSNISESIQYFSARLLYFLRAELALLGFTSRNYEDNPAQAGSYINISDLKISGTANVRTINGAVNADDMSSVQNQVQLKQIYKAVKVDNLQKTFSNVDLMDEAASRLGVILADGADSQLTGLWSQIPYEVGKFDGSGAFNSTDKMNVLASARKTLTNNKVPRRDLQAVIGPTEAFNLRTLDLFQQAQQRGDSEGLREGTLGRVMGFDVRESQSTPATVTLTTATIWGTPLVNNGPGYPIGTTSIAVNGLGAGTIKAGSIFNFGADAYSVTADATITANAATLVFTPALKTAVVNAQALNGPAGTGTPTGHSAAGSVGFAYHPDAFLWVVRPLADFIPGSGVVSHQQVDPISGLAVRVSIQSQVAGGAGTAMQETITADFLCGAGLIRPEMSVRISGQV
jgi:hypothetical protein